MPTFYNYIKQMSKQTRPVDRESFIQNRSHNFRRYPVEEKKHTEGHTVRIA